MRTADFHGRKDGRGVGGMGIVISSIEKSRLLALTVLTLAVSALEMFGLSLFIPVIDTFQGQAATPSAFTRHLSQAMDSFGLRPTLGIFLLLLSLLFILKGILAMWLRWMGADVASELQHRLRCRLFHAFLRADVAQIHARRQGTLLSALNEHTQRASQSCFILSQLAAQWTTVLVYTVFIFLVSWKLSLVAFGISLLLIPLIRGIGDRAHVHGRGLTAAMEVVQHTALEALQAKKLVNAMNWRDRFSNLYREQSAVVRRAWTWMAFWSNSPSIILQSVSVVILSLLIWVSLRFDLTAAMLGAFIVAFIRLLPSVQAASVLGADLRANLPAVLRLEEVLREAEEQREPSGDVPFRALHSEIRLRSVGFRYEDGRDVLRDVDLRLPRGKTVALVGPSGAGKTTIADLIVGLYRPTTGRVLVDDTDLNDLDLQSYRARIAYVPQEPMLFHDSIRGNLTFGLERRVSDREIREVCEQVGAWDFISRRKEGMDSRIGDRGVLFSGGQRQRLVLARALLRQPEILILDEATSALDRESEKWIENTLLRLQESGRVTILIVAHRFATIRRADDIYRVEDGRVSELGDWERARKILLSSKQALELM